MSDARRKWIRRLAAVSIVLLIAALLGVFTPQQRDAHLTFALRPHGSRLQITLPEQCALKTLRRGECPEPPRGTLRITAANGWSAQLPLNAAAAEWQNLERALQALPPGCTWTVAGADLPPDQPDLPLFITLHGPADVMRDWISWARLLPAE